MQNFIHKFLIITLLMGIRPLLASDDAYDYDDVLSVSHNPATAQTTQSLIGLYSTRSFLAGLGLTAIGGYLAYKNSDYLSKKYKEASKKFTKKFPRAKAVINSASRFLSPILPLVVVAASCYGLLQLSVQWNYINPETAIRASDVVSWFFGLKILLELLVTSTSRGITKTIDSTTRFTDIAGEKDNNIPKQARILVDYIKDPTAFTSLGAPQYKGILLYGPPGTGKTLLARAIAGEARVPFLHVNVSEVESKWVGEAEKNIKALFAQARDAALWSGTMHAIVFFDEFDSLALNRDDQQKYHKSLITTLLEELDGIEQDDCVKITVLASTNRLQDLDPAIRRPGRFDQEIEMPFPNPEGRKVILEKYLTTIKYENADDEQEKTSLINALVQKTEGFSPAQLEGIIKEAARLAGAKKAATVSNQFIYEAMQEIHTKSVLERRVNSQAVNVEARLSDVAGELPTAINELIKYLKSPDIQEAYKNDNLKPYKGFLLYGPPGTGKTSLARAIAGEAQVPFFNLENANAKCKGAEKTKIEEVFKQARNAAHYNHIKTAIIFIDEIDEFVKNNEAYTTLLTEMDGFNKTALNIVVIAATNRQNEVPNALLRAGRFDTRIEISLPNAEKRKSIIQKLLQRTPSYEHYKNDAELKAFSDHLARHTEKFSPAQLAELINETKRRRISDNLPKLTNDLILKALEEQQKQPAAWLNMYGL